MRPLDRTRIEKAAADCGFDLPPTLRENALLLGSTRFPETVEVRVTSGTSFELSVSDATLLESLPLAQYGWTLAEGVPALYTVLERAAATARTMPDRVAAQYHLTTKSMPRSTEAERMVLQRVGQDLFRRALLDYWRGRCCVTGLAVQELLRASHIKPWAACDSDEERLDVFNGLLLAPHLDALFDGGWVSFDARGVLMIANSLPRQALSLLGLQHPLAVNCLTSQHQRYLALHRSAVFKR
jgi:putative restriction endonuclease